MKYKVMQYSDLNLTRFRVPNAGGLKQFLFSFWSVKQLGEFCHCQSQGSVIDSAFLCGKTVICSSPFCKLPLLPLMFDHLFPLFEFKTVRSLSKAQDCLFFPETAGELTLPVCPAASSNSGEALAALQNKSHVTNPQDLSSLLRPPFQLSQYLCFSCCCWCLQAECCSHTRALAQAVCNAASA